MDKGNFFKRNIRAIVFFILNLILFSGLLSCVILYVNKTRSNFIEQNISQVESVNNAAGELSINYLNHESTDVTDLTNYASIKYQDGTFKDINDLANYFYDSNSVRDVTYEIIGTDYKGIVCLKDSEGNFPSISYTNSSYAKIQEIFLAAKTGEQNKAFVSSEFSDQYSALKSFAIYSYFEMKSSTGEDFFYTIMQIIDSQSFQDLIYFNGGYKDISTVLLDSDGVYIVSNPTFKASSFFRYLYINNNLTLSQMNAIHDEVIEKKSGYLTYKDSRNEDAVFVYNEVDETREWFTITVLPMKDFKVFSESNIYIYFILAILGVIAVSDTFYFYIINRKVKEAYARSQKASLAKSEFLSRMSHDIRTPLNGIIGLTNIILDNNELDPKVRESEEEVLTASDFLLSLLNDILDMSKIEAKKMELYPTPYFKEEMAKYLNAVIQPLCDKKSIEFKVNFDTKDNIGINIDKQRLNQIVFNLLSNAVKFTPNGGNVSLSFSLDDLKKKMRIVVKDNGQGMSKEFQKEMFESFTQEHRNETNSTGTGLGLSIVYQLVKLMDGNIVVNSEINKGSTFTINIPVELVSGQSMSFNETKIDEGVLKGLRVLVAEDNELNRKIAINLLESRGMIVDQAEDGEKAYNKYIENEDYYYDVIFLDVRMPIMDGLECAQLIRRAKKGDSSNIILIAMTANAFQEDYDKSAKAGINYHLVKPIDPSILYRTVARLIGERNELRRKSINKK